MSEKLLAGLATAAVVAPLCSVCILGPAVMASVFTGAVAWFSGFDTLLVAGLVVLAGVGALLVVRDRRSQRARASAAEETGQ